MTKYTKCISCSTWSIIDILYTRQKGYDIENAIFEFGICKAKRNKLEIKKSTQQSLWVRFLYWLVK